MADNANNIIVVMVSPYHSGSAELCSIVVCRDVNDASWPVFAVMRLQFDLHVSATYHDARYGTGEPLDKSSVHNISVIGHVQMTPYMKSGAIIGHSGSRR